MRVRELDWDQTGHRLFSYLRNIQRHISVKSDGLMINKMELDLQSVGSRLTHRLCALNAIMIPYKA